MTNNTYEMEALIPLVAALTEKYTSKESSSITYDKARQLMGAVIYCINEQEQHNNGEGGEVRKVADTISAQIAYKTGYELVMKKVLMSAVLCCLTRLAV